MTEQAFELISVATGELITTYDQDEQTLRDHAWELLDALELCRDVLSDLARLDDGTPSISALDLARAVIAKAKGGAA